MENTIFYGLAGVLIVMSILTVSVQNLLHAAISLIGSFFATAALYIVFQMEFVALAQIMIYIGGIVIFMVITILLTAQLGARNLFPKTPLQRSWGLTVCALLFAVLWWVAKQGDAPTPGATAPEPATLAAIGHRLLAADGTGFLVPFEVISLLLLTALVGAVVVARRDPEPEAAETPSAEQALRREEETS
ncbi:MAG: NADH-quinone oxidoreductase subunit J [Thermodesulfobacteriota bacterium]